MRVTERLAGHQARRQRVAAPAATVKPAGNGGASLFTPAYRVRHATAVQTQVGQGRLGAATPLTDTSGYDVATEQPGSGYGWSESRQAGSSYQQADYARDDAAPPSWADDDLPASGYSWLTDDGAGSGWPTAMSGRDAGASSPRNAIRGLPPVPDEPLPIYQPGPFAAWNKGSPDRGEGSPRSADLGSGPGWNSQPGARGQSGVQTLATITPDEFDTNHSMPAIKDPIRTAADDANDRMLASGPRSNVRAAGEQRHPGDPAPGRRAPGGRASGGRTSGGEASRKSRTGHGSRPRHQPVWLAIGAAVVIIAGVTTVLVTTSLGSKPATPAAQKPPAKPKPTQAAPSPPAGKWEYIGTRATDPMPLTLPEVFPMSFVAKGVLIHATALKQGHNCHAALIGTSLQAAVKKAECTQVLRASYVGRLDNAMATIGVFNLTTAVAANQAAQHVGTSEFVAQLVTKKGLTSKIGQGTGIEEALVKGHYLVLVWAEKTDLTTPSTPWQRQHLTNFMNQLIGKTLNGSLSYRMVEGKPGPKAQTPAH